MGRPIRVVRPRRHRLRSADYRSRHRIQYRCCCCNSVDKTVTIASALSVTRDFGIDRLTTPVVGRCVCVCMNAGREGRRGGAEAVGHAIQCSVISRAFRSLCDGQRRRKQIDQQRIEGEGYVRSYGWAKRKYYIVLNSA